MHKKLILIIIILLLLFSNIGFSENKLSEKFLKEKLQNSKEPERTVLYIELAKLTEGAKSKEGIEYAKKALNLSRKFGQIEKEADSLILLGKLYFENGNNINTFENKKRSLNYMITALHILEKLKLKRKIADLTSKIAVQYVYWGDMGKTLDYALRSLKLSEETGMDVGVGRSATTIGTVYYYMKKYNKSIEFYKKALKIAKKLGSKNYESLSLINIGTSFFGMKEYQKALRYFNTAKKIAEEFDIKTSLNSVYMNISEVFKAKKEFGKSVKYGKKSLLISEKINDKAGIIESQNILGSIYRSMGNLSVSIDYYLKCLENAGNFGYNPLVQSCYKALSGLYEKKGDSAKALEYYKLYIEKKEKIFNEENSKKIAKMEVEFENVNQKNEIEILKKNNQIYEINSKRQKTFRTFLIIIVILVFIILVLLFGRYRYFLKYWKTTNVVGKYRIIKKLGSGGMADVFKARSGNKRSGEIVALKMVREDISNDDKFRKRFITEEKICREISHPNIVKILESGEFKGRLYLVMEFLEGETLKSILSKEKRLSVETSLQIVRAVAEALTEIHRKGIVHRDIKPGNIMVGQFSDKDISIKILDFGIATYDLMTRLTKAGSVAGTLSYMSPEQLLDSSFSSASDIYSLGVIFFEMVTGETPYKGESSLEIMQNILKESYKEPESLVGNIPGWVNSIIIRMIKRDPSKRPSAEDLINLIKSKI